MKTQGISAEKDPACLWLSPPEELVLGKDEVHVWRVSLKLTAPELNVLQELLSDDEIKRAGNYHFQKDRDNFIASRGVLRVILAKYLQRAPEQLHFCYGLYGKPFLITEKSGREITFNVTHSNGLALYAVACNREVGIDLEYVRNDETAEIIVQEFFSEREIAALNALANDARQKAFYTFWTKRETLLKASGRGVASDFDGGMMKDDMSLNEKKFSVAELNAGPSYAAAIAVEGQDYLLSQYLFFLSGVMKLSQDFVSKPVAVCNAVIYPDPPV